MGIGTSLGAYFDTSFNHSAGIQDPGDRSMEVKPGDTGDDSVMPPEAPVEPGGALISEASMIATNPSATAKNDVEDRRDEDWIDQLYATGHGLKVWGHNLIHPDPIEGIPNEPSDMAKELGYNNISVDKTPDRMRDIRMYKDELISDVVGTGKFLHGMYTGLRNELNK